MRQAGEGQSTQDLIWDAVSPQERAVCQAQSSAAPGCHASPLHVRMAAEGTAGLRQRVLDSRQKNLGRPDSEPAEWYEALLLLLAQFNKRIQFILDGNRAWDSLQATSFLSAVPSSRILYCEEPLIDPRELPALQQQVGIPMALDETLSEAQQYGDLIHDWDSVFVLKPDRIEGSIETCLALAAAAHAKGNAVVVSSAYNTEVGLSFLAQLAAALHCPHAGLDTQRWFAPPAAPGNVIATNQNVTISLDELLHINLERE